MKSKILVLFLLAAISVSAQQPNAQQKFLQKLEKLCGKSFEGTITAGGREGDGFTGQKLVMSVLSCENNQIKIPFFVGDNKSRTWILTPKDGQLELKHDHRHEDGSDDKVTMYGGITPNTGSENMQFFPADPYTCDLINYACSNVWWITLDNKTYTYNLRRIGSDRVFTVSFDLTKPITFTEKPWGWKH